MAALLLLACAAAAAAQRTARLTGIVRDTAHNVLSDVVVQVFSQRDELLATTRSDVRGVYNVDLAERGGARLRARRLGFQAFASGDIVLSADSASRLDITLVPVAQRLGEVIVKAESNRSVFLERAAAGGRHAHFIDSTSLAGRDKRSMLVLFNQLSGTSIHVGTPVQGGRGVSYRPAEGGDVLMGPGNCVATVYVDGWLTGAAELRRVLRAPEVAGIEIYDVPALAPFPYRPDTLAKCPIVLIWSGAGFSWEPRKW